MTDDFSTPSNMLMVLKDKNNKVLDICVHFYPVMVFN